MRHLHNIRYEYLSIAQTALLLSIVTLMASCTGEVSSRDKSEQPESSTTQTDSNETTGPNETSTTDETKEEETDGTEEGEGQTNGTEGGDGHSHDKEGGADDYDDNKQTKCLEGVTGVHCAGPSIENGSPDSLYRCDNQVATLIEECARGCTIVPDADDMCVPQPPPSPTCESGIPSGRYCAGNRVLHGATDTLYQCKDGVATVVEVCQHGCILEQDGKHDRCANAPVHCDLGSHGLYCGGNGAHQGDPDSVYFCEKDGRARLVEKCPAGCVRERAGVNDHCKTESVYKLPYKCKKSYRCTTPNHVGSHKNKGKYAYDFAMPLNSNIHAIRGGTVLRVRTPSRPGSPCYSGGGINCANLANSVEILHSDGTVALYLHINSATVSKGQSVSQGQVIAKSGSTGYSTGPHLHLQLQSNCGIWWCQSKPLVFEEAAKINRSDRIVSKNCPSS